MKKWKKISLWTLAAVLVLLMVAGVTLVLLLEHSEGFRRSILAKVESGLQESAGAKISVRDFNLRLSNLSLDLYNVVVRGTEQDANKPLLQADHLQGGLTIDSVFNRKWHVRDIIIDHPVVHVAVNKAGENNLPKPPKPSTGSKTNVFDLAVRTLKLDRGEIYYNDRKTPLDAELHDLKLNAGYDSVQSGYSGTLSYDNAKLVYGKYAPVEHNLQARFAVTPEQFRLDNLDLAAGTSRISLTAALDNYSSPRMRASGKYDATLVTSDFQRILSNSSLPAGTVRLTGELDYQPDPNRPALKTISVAGSVSSAALSVKTPSLRTEVRDIYARYKLTGGNAELNNIRARVLGGTLNGRLTIRDLTGASAGRLQASVKDLSLDQAQAVARTASLRQANLKGAVSADLQAQWAKTLDNLIAHVDATLQASVGQGTGTPLNGVVHADYAAAHKEIALTGSYVRTPQTTVNLQGKVSDRSQLVVALRSNDLHELELLAAGVQKPAPGQQPQPLGLYGTANVDATVSGSLNKPQINGRMQANNLRVKGSSWKVLRTGFSANPSQVRLNSGDLEAVPQGRINFSVQATLKNWAYSASNPVMVNVSAAQISIGDLERLANKSYPISGTLALNVSVHGSQLKPIGQGTLTIANAKVSDESIQNVNLKFQGDGSALNAGLTVRMPAGTARADVDYFPQTQQYNAKVHAQDFRLEKLQTVKARNMKIAGGVNVNVTGNGTVSDPQLQATVDIPQLLVNQQSIQGVKLQTTVKDHVANLALDSQVINVAVKAKGTIGIESPYLADLRLDTGRVDFKPLLAIYAPENAADIAGQTELHATVRGPLRDKRRAEAHLEVPSLTMSYKQFQLAAAKPIRVDYQNGTAVLQPTSIRGTDTTIDAQAIVPVTDTKAASFQVRGNIDLRVAELFVPDVQSTGQIQFDLDSRRYAPGSNLNGQIKIVNANVHTADSPVGLVNANGVINVTQTRLEIANFQSQIGGGTITATGALAYRPSMQFHLGMEARNIRLRYPEGMRAMLATNLALTGNMKESLLSGQVNIERVSFTPDFDLSTFVGQFSGQAADAGVPGSFTQGMKLNITVQSTNQMNLENSQVSIRGNANLRVAGTAAEPVILGRTTLTGGELFIAGNRYEIQQGTIDFINPVQTQPIVNLQIRSTINDYVITLNLNGPVDRLEITYTSDPPLPPVDIINLIARGQTTEAAAQTPTPPGTLGAQSVVASAVSSQVSSKIARLAGVSQLQIDPALGTDNGQNPGARIAIQQRVTGNLLVTYATDITSTQRQAIQVEYKLNPKWSVNGTRNQNGGFGMDGRYRKDF
jgi:translocation and assembly module TamB